MKDQYFGDVNDYRKYGLLRQLAGPQGLRIGVCWMLTAPDERPDGKIRGYVRQPQKFRHFDQPLYDWLERVNISGQPLQCSLIESTDLLGTACYHSEMLTDDPHRRRVYFRSCNERFAETDLVFFDPDNGIEVKSKSIGHKNSNKYVYWDEVCSTFQAGKSVLIYQHLPREKRGAFRDRMRLELMDRTGAATVFSFLTPKVLFLLAPQDRYIEGFRARVREIQETWPSSQIDASEIAHEYAINIGLPQDDSYYKSLGPAPAEGKILARAMLDKVLTSHRNGGERIVFTNGCFDILHVGHARYLAEARSLGDLLVVGVNSDESVRRLKGPSRPLVPQDERAEMLAHLAVVDYVSIFDESRPDALIEVVRPAIHVKGGDYREEDLPEAETVRKHGGKVVILPLVEGRSTTNVIARILEANT